jgi:uncharacterized repeat protein (TIGR01451 family)
MLHKSMMLAKRRPAPGVRGTCALFSFFAFQVPVNSAPNIEFASKTHGSSIVEKLLFVSCCILISLFLADSKATAAITVTPSTWNIVGLDSNSPSFGPQYFPVGAKVCSTSAVSNVPVTFNLSNINPYISQRPGSLSSFTIPSIAAGACADAYFEVQVTQTALAFDTSTSYSVTTPGASTPVPRELYVEHLISQSRNSISDVKLNGASIPAGGAMNLVVGNTYTIELDGGTATQGYNQFEAFINFPNTIFQILAVNTTYSADNNTANVPNPNSGLYANACQWDNDPGSLTYRSCIGGDYKAGGSNVVTTYTVKILSGGGTTQTLNTLLYDFSGSSFHYNADYSTSARIANIIDPASVTISKGFFPSPTNVANGSALTFTISNPNAGAVGGLNFIDDFTTVVVAPAGGTLRMATPLTTTNTCGGTLTDHAGNPLAAGSAGIKLSGGTVSANSSCIVEVKVAPSAGSAAGTTYANTSNHLFVNTLDTGKFATATLIVNTTAPPAPPPSSCPNPVELARWEMLTTTTGPGTTGPPYTRRAGDVSTATTRFVSASGVQSVANINGRAYAWGGTAPTAGASWSENPTAPNYTLNNYFEFVLDTSNYGGVGVTFDSGLDASGDWANPTSPIYVTSSTDGTTFSLFTPSPTVSKNSWSIGLVATAAATGTDKTTFRFATSGSSKPAGVFALDNITFTGCPRVKPPVMKKLFSTNPVLTSGFSQLVFTISNPNQSVDLTGVTFTDVFPTSPGAMTLYDAVTINTCGGTLTSNSGGVLAANAPGIKLTGATVTKGSSCTVTVNVKAPNTGSYVNSTTVSDATAGNGNTTSDTLTVNPPHPVISLFKEVATSTSAPGPSSILWNSNIALKTGDKVYYQFTVQNDGDVPLDSVTLTDADLAAVDPGLSLSNCIWKNGDDVTINPVTPSAQNFSLVVANNSNNQDFAYCIIGPIFAVSGSKTNTATANAMYNSAAITPDSDSATYNGFAPPSVTKSFLPVNISIGGTSAMTIKVTNPASNPGNLTGVSISDSYTGTLKNNAAGSVACSGTGSATLTGGVNNGTTVGFNTGTIVPGGTCTITQSVTATATENNSTGSPSSTGIVVPTRGAASMALTGTAAGPVTLTVSNFPTLTKAFALTTVVPGQSSTLTFTLTNSTGNPVQSGLAFTDTMPANITVTAAAGSQCNGTVSFTASNVSLAGGSMASGVGSCTVTASVTSSALGTWTNGSGNISVAGGNLVNGVTDQSLQVVSDATLTILKTADKGTAKPGEIITYTLLVTNTGGVVASNISISDVLSPYVALGTNSYPAAVAPSGPVFDFTGTGALPTPGTPQFFNNSGISITPSGAYDGNVAKWTLPFTGTLGANGDNFTIKYKTQIK